MLFSFLNLDFAIVTYLKKNITSVEESGAFTFTLKKKLKCWGFI